MSVLIIVWLVTGAKSLVISEESYLSQSVQGKNALNSRHSLDVLLNVSLAIHGVCLVVGGCHLCQALSVLQVFWRLHTQVMLVYNMLPTETQKLVVNVSKKGCQLSRSPMRKIIRILKVCNIKGKLDPFIRE